MNDKPRRLSLRFSLRLMLLVITGICIWLAWEVGVVHNRRVVRKEAEAASLQFSTAVAYQLSYQFSLSGAPARARVSFVRRLFGDEAIQAVYHFPYINGPQETELA